MIEFKNFRKCPNCGHIFSSMDDPEYCIRVDILHSVIDITIECSCGFTGEACVSPPDFRILEEGET